MTRLLLVAAFAAFSALAAGPASAAFDVAYEQGTRTDVRAWCATDGGVLSDREDYTMCIAQERGASFTCDDDGACTRTGFDLSTGSIRPIPGVTVAPTSEILPQPISGTDYVPLPYTGFGGLDIVTDAEFVTTDPVTTGGIKPTPSPYLPYTGHGGLDIIE